MRINIFTHAHAKMCSSTPPIKVTPDPDTVKPEVRPQSIVAYKDKKCHMIFRGDTALLTAKQTSTNIVLC